MAVFKIPELNPLHFVEESFTQLAQYRSKHMGDWPFPATIRMWEQQLVYAQPWQLSDRIRLQIVSEIGPIKAVLVDMTGNIVFSQNLAQLQQSTLQPTFFIYQLDLALSVFPEGLYFLFLEFGSPVARRLQSNLLEFSTEFADSLYFEYKHFKFFGDAYFENGFSPSIRITGTLKFDKSAARSTIYEDQDADMQILAAKTYNLWKLYLGGPEGLPDFMVPKFNDILCMSDLKIDGRSYTRAVEGSQLEKKEEEGYPMAGYAIDLREKNQRNSRIWDVTSGQIVQGTTAVINVEKKGFVADDQGGSFYEVTDVE